MLRDVSEASERKAGKGLVSFITCRHVVHYICIRKVLLLRIFSLLCLGQTIDYNIIHKVYNVENEKYPCQQPQSVG